MPHLGEKKALPERRGEKTLTREERERLLLAKEILKSTGNGIKENMSMDEVQVNLRSILKKKRFFIVLDDV